MYLAMNNDQQAFTEIENLAKEYPYDMRYLTILGDVYLNNGKEEEAYETYQKVLKEETGLCAGVAFYGFLLREKRAG